MYLADRKSLLNIEWDCIIVSDEYRRMWKEVSSCQHGNVVFTEWEVNSGPNQPLR